MTLVAFPATAQEPVCLLFDTELVSLDLTGGPFPMPLAADPANALGDSIDGFGFVDSDVTLTLSSQRDTAPGPRSTGQAFASAISSEERPEGCGEEEVDPGALIGEQFFVESFFDVFFDITVTDVDSRPGRDYAGAPDGAVVTLPDNGPGSMTSLALVPFDKDAPNFGLIPPPEVAPYIGHFDIEIPLGGDINGNGENDRIKFTLATHSVGDENRTFATLPDGTVIDEFDSAAFLAGAVVDESSDPPFQIGQLLPSGLPDPAVFGGPTTATSKLVNPVVVPDSDGDGVLDDDDVCPGTVVPDPNVPTDGLGTKRWALMDADGSFDTTHPKGKAPKRSFTLADTAGCNAEQIADALGLGKGHYKFGLSTGAMKTWVALVS